MKSIVRAATLVAAILPVLVCAAGSTVQGNWEGTIPGDTPTPIYLQLAVDGATVHGAVIANGSEQSIKDGHVTGAVLEFTTQRIRLADRDVRFAWSGLVDGEQISFNVIAEDRDGAVTEVVVKRQHRHQP